MKGSWLIVALVCLAAALPVVAGLGRAPFDDPGEGMHAEIARELLVSGDPFGLRLNGVRYVDKPPMLYWLIALGFRGLGLSEAPARVVSALAGLAAVAAVAWLGARLLGRWEGVMAGLALLTCVWFFVYTRYVRPETLFVAALAWGFALTLAGLQSERRGWVVGGLAAFGLAGLAKDPLGAIAPVLVLAGVMALSGRFRPVSRWLPPGGVLAAALLAVGWYLIVEYRTRGFIWYTVVDNHVLNVMAARQFPDEDVPLGVFEFLSVAALGAAPWTVSALVGIVDLVRRRAWRVAARCRGWCSRRGSWRSSPPAPRPASGCRTTGCPPTRRWSSSESAPGARRRDASSRSFTRECSPSSRSAAGWRSPGAGRTSSTA